MAALGKPAFIGVLWCARHFTTLFHLVFADVGFLHVLMDWNAFLREDHIVLF